MNDEFYIGWEDKCPPQLAKRLRAVVLGIAGIVAGVVSLVAISQGRFDDGTFEFGQQRTFSGVLLELPVPMLRVTGNSGAVTNHLLVGFGKHGLPDFARGHDGAKVRFNGTLIHRDGLRMIEMNDAASFEILGPPAAPERRMAGESPGEVALTGELVDTKCWSGVMRPATGKVHRACAIRCLSGGVPPGLLVRDAQHNAIVVLLAGADGETLEFDIEWAARVLEVRGRLEWHDEVPVVRVSRMTLAD
jgi:hypothetical protein